MTLYGIDTRQFRTQRLKVAALPDMSEYETNEVDTHRNHQKAGLYDLVIIARKAPPVPISNTTVKLLSADGTMS